MVWYLRKWKGPEKGGIVVQMRMEKEQCSQDRGRHGCGLGAALCVKVLEDLGYLKISAFENSGDQVQVAPW